MAAPVQDKDEMSSQVDDRDGMSSPAEDQEEMLSQGENQDEMSAGVKDKDELDTQFKDQDVVYYLRDRNKELVQHWNKMFAGYQENFKVSYGDIFRDAPAVDAIVSPANSFGFMDGGIDFVYTKHFGQQMQDRLQKLIRSKYKGELLVGKAVVIPTYGPEGRNEKEDWSKYNEGVAIKFLISAPTMRVTLDVDDTANAYLAFRAAILAIQKHNRRTDVEPIKSVLVPGLGTAVGRMPKLRCAWQMLQAYETFVKGKHNSRVSPNTLGDIYCDHLKMCEYGDD